MAEMEERIETVRSFLIKYKPIILISWLVLSVLLLIIGVILMNSSSTKIWKKGERVLDFTDCKRVVDRLTCREYLKENPTKICICYEQIDISLKGKVTLYYELPEFDQTLANYSNSKDNDQLRGILTETPSSDCTPYQYDDNKRPIAPCGAIADSMFLDKIHDLKKFGNTTVLVGLLRYGMLSAEDKAGFQNPPNLSLALQNYSKPTHWPKHIYTLDEENEDNNGFQNEYFISWMNTDWKRKPIARINHSDTIFKDGLPNATYQISIKYYVSDIYNYGRRKIIFVGTEEFENAGSQTSGAVVLTLGLLMFAVGLYPILAKIYSDKKNRDKEANANHNVNDTSPPPLLSEETNASRPVNVNNTSPRLLRSEENNSTRPLKEQ